MMADDTPGHDEQELLARVQRSLEYGGPGVAARDIYRWIYGEEVELTSPQWVELWARTRPALRDLVSPVDLKRLDDLFQAVQPTDPAVFDLPVSQDDSVVFVLGAGASAPPPSGLPTVSDLLPELWRRARRLGSADLRALESWCKDQGISNIEDLLTAAYIANFSSKSSPVLALLDYFLYSRDGRDTLRPGGRRRVQSDASALALLQETLQTLFGLLLGRMIQAEPNAAHESIVKMAQKTGRVGVITTNYDACIDQAFANQMASCNYFIGDSNGITGGTEIIKMHGSINWAYCDSCQEARLYRLADLREAYDKDTIGFPVISICRNCGGQRRPMVVPPLSFKFVQFPPLLQLWHQAQLMLNKASLIIPVGYSFAEADTYITKMTTKAMVGDGRKKLVVVDKDVRVHANLSRQLSDVIDDFDTDRVLRSTESCEKIVPRLVEKLLSPMEGGDGRRQDERQASSALNPPSAGPSSSLE